MPWNAHVCPGTTVSYSAPLTDCTSAVHNFDNIQNGALCLAASKPAAPARKYTNDPYRRTTVTGAPLFPPSPIPPEVNFMMSHGDARRQQPPCRPPPTAAAGSSGSAAATSVTHVRCKRVYVNGRPVTVWLNDSPEAK